MSGKRIFAIILLTIMMASFALNPTKDEIRSVLSKKATSTLRKELGVKHEDAYQLAMTLYGDEMIQKIMNTYSVVENYYVFSIAKVSWQGGQTMRGGGAFDQIWFSKQIDDNMEDSVDTLKKIG